MADSADQSGVQPAAIGRYRIDQVLGRGAMGVVYLGYDALIERSVAIKTIHRSLLEGTNGLDWLARFRREVRAAGRCLHPNIVTVFEYGEEGDVPYIAMEYVQGRDLRFYLKDRQPMPLARAVAVVIQVLQALGHAHDCGVVHRDIKPNNIILLADGQVKVTDFGIARLESVSGMTQHGMTVGTPAYMAPEQFQGQEADRRADLYATGVVLFELLTGVRPYPGRNAGELMYQVAHDAPRRATQLNPRLPAELDWVLAKALARILEQRFQNAGEFIAALESLNLAGREVAADGSTPSRAAASAPALEPPIQGPQGWDPALLAQAEQMLTVCLGPIARVLVRKAAAQSGSPAELARVLAAAIPNERDRLMFERRLRAAAGDSIASGASAALTAGSSMASRISGPMGDFDQALLETARQSLAIYLGPIAKVLVKQASREARTPRELYQKLAQHIPAAADRAAFLQRAPTESAD